MADDITMTKEEQKLLKQARKERVAKTAKVIGITVGATAAVCGATYGISNMIFNNACKRCEKQASDRMMPAGQKEMLDQVEKYADRNEATREWLNAQELKTVSIVSFDGLRLIAELLEHDDAKGTVITIHGYRSNCKHELTGLIKSFYERGYNVLMIYQRACGKSEGQYITFGVNERLDLIDWIDAVNKRYGDKDVFVFGISMGAATALMAGGMMLPQNVKGIIADCGFVSPYKILAHVIKDYKLPEVPFLTVADLIARRKAGFSFNEADTVSAMCDNKVPVLFIHGDADSFVPLSMTYANYEACRAQKRLVIVKGAKHGMAYFTDTPRYEKALDEFFEDFATNETTEKVCE